MSLFDLKAFIAAEPVSPEVAPSIDIFWDLFLDYKKINFLKTAMHNL